MLHSCAPQWICIYMWAVAAAAAHICSDIIFWQIRFRQNNGLHHHQGGREECKYYVQFYMLRQLQNTIAPLNFFLCANALSGYAMRDIISKDIREREMRGSIKIIMLQMMYTMALRTISFLLLYYLPRTPHLSSTHIRPWPHIIFQLADAAAHFVPSVILSSFFGRFACQRRN